MSVNIFVVDTGMNEEHPELLKYTSKIIDKFGIAAGKKSTDYRDELGHGTAIASLILRHIGNCPDINIVSVKIFTAEMHLNEYHLISALKYLSINYNPDIINLSLGINISEDISQLHKVCNEITDKGTIIIAAFDNSGSISYPAAFDNVIGVTTGDSCYRTDDFEYINDTVVNIAAKGNLQRIAWKSPPYIMLGGNSFACAHVTAKVAEFINNGVCGKEAILEELKKIAKKIHMHNECDCISNDLFSIKKAAIFPFNKEMHALIRFSHLLPFQIVDVYDTVYSAIVGADTTVLMKDTTVKSMIVKNINSIDWDRFDTLIIGHIGNLSSLINKAEEWRYLVEKALKKDKCVFSYDDLENMGYINSEKVYYPQVNISAVPPIRFGMLYRISKPVVGVFGTSSRQGKFTLQLKLREMFLKHGYNVGQLGTEPNSMLFGMDYVFPMGYNSSVYIQGVNVIRLLNGVINKMCENGKDIIIVGSQSGTVTYDVGNIAQYNISQYEFLLGTQPDAVVLCVNPYDEEDYIQRTIYFIESSTNGGKVIALVVFPMDISNNWLGFYNAKQKISDEKYKQLQGSLKKKFRIPVYKLGKKKDMSGLYHTIVEHFEIK